MRRRRDRAPNHGHSTRRVSARLRERLDTEAVVHIAVEEVLRELGADRSEVWFVRGRGMPTRASSAGRLDATTGGDTQALVRKAARRRRPVATSTMHAAPIVAPRSGLLGVLVVARPALTDADRSFVDDVSSEVGYALETASLFEQALAGKEKSEAILGRVGDAIVVTDVRGRIVQWNERASWYFERDGADAEGSSCAAVLALRSGEGPLDCSTGCALFTATPETADGFGVEVQRARKDGRPQPLLANVSPVLDPDGVPYEIVHSFRDITRLREADEAKTMFLATASHELKTPLTVIQGFAQLLAATDAMSPEQRAEALDAIVRRAGQLDGIIERLLLSSRIETGRTEVEVGPTDLGPIVADTAEEIGKATGRTIDLRTDGAPGRALADEGAVITIVQHLVENAIKYSAFDTPVEVSVSGSDLHVELRVTDSGVGMDCEQAAHCFEKFWQAESSDIRRFGGTGIGLYIVRSLVRAMDGTVRVSSRPGEGTTFTVLLPRADVTRPAVVEPTVRPEPSVIREFMRQMGIPTAREVRR